MSHTPTLPYGGTEGHAKHPSSANRLGVSGKVQPGVLQRATAMGVHGVTSREVQTALGRGHGTVSGALSALHRSGHLAMLQNQRGGQHVYVIPVMVAGRETRQPRSNAAHDEIMRAAAALNAGRLGEAVQIVNAYAERCKS